MKLIDPQMLKLAIRDDPEISGRNYARMKKHINEAPTVELIRCKECKYYTPYDCVCDHPQMWTTEEAELKVADDSFCSYGERRPDGKS